MKWTRRLEPARQPTAEPVLGVRHRRMCSRNSKPRWRRRGVVPRAPDRVPADQLRVALEIRVEVAER